MLGSYLLVFTIGVSHAQTPSQFALRQHNHKQLLLVKRRLHFCLANTVRHLSKTWASLDLVKRIKISRLEVSSHNPSETDL